MRPRANPIEDVMLPADVLVMLDEAAEAGVPVGQLYRILGAVGKRSKKHSGVGKSIHDHTSHAKLWFVTRRGGETKATEPIVSRIVARLKEFDDQAVLTVSKLAELFDIPDFEHTFSQEAIADEAHREWRAWLDDEQDAEDGYEAGDEQAQDALMETQLETERRYYDDWLSALLSTTDEIFERYGIVTFHIRAEKSLATTAVRLIADDWVKVMEEMGRSIDDAELSEEEEPNEQIAARDYVLKHLDEIWTERYSPSPEKRFRAMLRTR